MKEGEKEAKRGPKGEEKCGQRVSGAAFDAAECEKEGNLYARAYLASWSADCGRRPISIWPEVRPATCALRNEKRVGDLNAGLCKQRRLNTAAQWARI